MAHSPAVGYHKALCPVVATLLLHMDEEEAFWLVVQMYKRSAPSRLVRRGGVGGWGCTRKDFGLNPDDLRPGAGRVLFFGTSGVPVLQRDGEGLGKGGGVAAQECWVRVIGKFCKFSIF